MPSKTTKVSARKTAKATTSKTSKTSVKKTSAKVTSAKKDVKAAIVKMDKAQDKIVDAAEDILSARVDAAQKIAKQAWFVGLGAYGRSFEELKSRYAGAGEEVQSRFSQITKEGQSFLKDLVARGEQVQDQAEDVLNDRREVVEQKIEAAKTRLISVVDVPARLKEVSNKLETLSKDLERKSA